MALKKYKERDLSEQEGVDYLKKSLVMEFYFQYSKIDNNEVLMGDLKCPPHEDLLV